MKEGDCSGFGVWYWVSRSLQTEPADAAYLQVHTLQIAPLHLYIQVLYNYEILTQLIEWF